MARIPETASSIVRSVACAESARSETREALERGGASVGGAGRGLHVPPVVGAATAQRGCDPGRSRADITTHHDDAAGIQVRTCGFLKLCSGSVHQRRSFSESIVGDHALTRVDVDGVITELFHPVYKDQR